MGGWLKWVPDMKPRPCNPFGVTPKRGRPAISQWAGHWLWEGQVYLDVNPSVWPPVSPTDLTDALLWIMEQ
jgi:hypothetical protein